MRRAALALGAVVTLAAAGACGRRDRDDAAAKAVYTRRDSVLVLGDGDVKIVNTDSTIELALVGDRIVMRFGDRAIKKIREGTDTTAVKDSGFGGSLEKLVKGAVAKSLEQQAEYPLSIVQNARYEHGEIMLDMKGSAPKLFAHTKVDNKPVMQTFAPADAERFVAAVKARKAQLAAPQNI